MDLFDTKGIKPMLIAEMQEAFDSPDWLYEVKLDGIRCVAYLGETTDLRNKRDKNLLPHLPELSNINRQVKTKCILDGEVFVLKDGITDFYEIQRRALMTDPFKIKIASEKYPASFVAFDILYHENHLVTELPLMERKKLLEDVMHENEKISISRYIENQGIALFNAAKEKGLEGVIAKRKDSLYHFDKRTRDWIKFKVMQTEDCVICGYIRKENNMISLVLGQYDNGMIVYRGHVTLGVTLDKLAGRRETDICPFESIPKGNEGAVWLVPELVGIVESMPTDKEAFRQPVFKGIRDDKRTEECVKRPTIFI